MGITANQNASSAKLALFLLAFACLEVFQPGWAKNQDIGQVRKAAEQVAKAKILTAEFRERIEASKSD